MSTIKSLASEIALFMCRSSSRKSSKRSKLPLLALYDVLDTDSLRWGVCTYVATSAYASIAFMFFLFFSAMGMMSLLAASRSLTLANRSSMNVRR